jgi:hypothetical protein
MGDIETFLFTSESVNEGHPDKLADQVFLQVGHVVTSVKGACLILLAVSDSDLEPKQFSCYTGVRCCSGCLPRAGPLCQGVDAVFPSLETCDLLFGRLPLSMRPDMSRIISSIYINILV